jgi:hypothetical protein
VVPIWKKYVVGFPLASTFPLSVTVLCVMLAGAPVVTAGLAALAVAGTSSASASTNNMAPRNIVPPVRKIAPIHARQHRAGANVAPKDMIS